MCHDYIRNMYEVFKDMIRIFTGVLGIVIVYCPSYTLADCGHVEIRDTKFQKVREGRYYKKSSDTWNCNGRSSYSQEDGDNYIFYLEVGGWRGWMVGTTWCTNRGGIAAEDDAPAPNEVTSTWEEVNGDSWWVSHSLTIKCTTALTGGQIAGIVLGCIIAISILAVIIACCAKESNKKHRTVNVQGAPRQARPPPRRQMGPMHPSGYSPYQPQIRTVNQHIPLQPYPAPYPAGPPYGPSQGLGPGQPVGLASLPPPPAYEGYTPVAGAPPAGTDPAYPPSTDTWGPPPAYTATAETHPPPVSST